MALPLPHVITPQPDTGDPVDTEAIQSNFDALKKAFPLSRKHLKLEQPIIIGSGGSAPAFQNSWVNFDVVVYVAARFWKDAFGYIHIEGVVKSGLAAPSTIFQLPTGYLPAGGHTYNDSVQRVDVSPTGQVLFQGSSNARVTLDTIHFRGA